MLLSWGRANVETLEPPPGGIENGISPNQRRRSSPLGTAKKIRRIVSLVGDRSLPMMAKCFTLCLVLDLIAGTYPEFGHGVLAVD